MKKITLLLLAGIAISVVVINFSCKKKGADSTPKVSFDRKALLTNMGNNIIVPAYQDLITKYRAFDSLSVVYTRNLDAGKLNVIQAKFKELYTAWQACSPVELGKADQAFLNLNNNTFPADTDKINGFISSGSINLDAAANVSAKGFPAIDYLLFGGSNDAVVALFTTDAKASSRQLCFQLIADRIGSNLTDVLNDWKSTYLNTFIAADGTDVGSSVGMLINKLDYDLDVLKNNKLGIPMGKQSMGVLYPQKTEAYYSGISAQLIVAQLQAMQNIYLGKGTQGDVIGFDDYLSQIGAKYNGGSLNDTIKNAFTVAISKVQAVPDPLSAAIVTNPVPVNEAYAAVQKLLVLLKTDMPSALGVLITYVDNDGD